MTPGSEKKPRRKYEKEKKAKNSKLLFSLGFDLLSIQVQQREESVLWALFYLSPSKITQKGSSSPKSARIEAGRNKRIKKEENGREKKEERGAGKRKKKINFSQKFIFYFGLKSEKNSSKIFRNQKNFLMVSASFHFSLLLLLSRLTLKFISHYFSMFSHRIFFKNLKRNLSFYIFYRNTELSKAITFVSGKGREAKRNGESILQSRIF